MGRVEACRICLITDVKMQRILGSLETNFKSVFGHNVLLSSDMPDYCCYECSALITKFSKFRKKYFTSQGLLFSILQNHGVVTEQEIKNIDRVASNLNSNLSAIVINSNEQLFEIKIECEPIEHALEMTVEDEIDNSSSEDDVPLHSVKQFEHVNVNSMNKKQHTSKRKNLMNTEKESGESSNKMKKIQRNGSTMKDLDVAKLTDQAIANGLVYLQADDFDDVLPDTIEDNNTSSSEISSKLLENQNLMIANQQTIMSKLSDFSAKFQNYYKTDMLTRNCATYNSSTPKADSKTIIENKKQLDEFENDLNDPEKRQTLRDKYSILFNGNGDGTTHAYILIDALFCRKFLTHCSWSGGSRGEESKIPFKVYNNTITFFHEIVRECDRNFSMINCYSFFKNVLRNSVKRSTSKLERMSTGRKRRRREEKKSSDIVDSKELLGLEAT